MFQNASLQPQYDEQLQFVNPITGRPVAGYAYRVIFEDGTMFEGTTCDEGKTKRMTTVQESHIAALKVENNRESV